MAGSKKYFSKILLGGITLSAILFLGGNFVFAGSPAEPNWLQLLADPMTSLNNDNTGDGGDNLPEHYNYYYVGQTFYTPIQIKSNGTSAANIWLDFNTSTVTSTAFTFGNFFSVPSVLTVNNGRIKWTGYNPSALSSGTGTFGQVTWNVIKPTAYNYGTSTWGVFDINTGVFYQTTESNISLNGNDIMDGAEDFNVLLWADTVLPYAQNPSPTSGLSGVAVEGNFTFDLLDTLRGEGSGDIGVGTGVNTALGGGNGSVTFNDGGGALSYNPYTTINCPPASYNIWGTNFCSSTVNPTVSPLSIAGDQRNWKYDTTYTVTVSGFKDFASPNQDQLGDSRGPNTMNQKIWTFRTETDSVKPIVENRSPATNTVNVLVSTNISFDILDKKFYPGNISGTGVNTSTCRINVSSASFPLTTYQQGSAGVTITPISYGIHVVIDPSVNFAQNETVTVSVFNCEDLATIPNVMITDTWTFVTEDTDAPWVDTISPANDAVIGINGTVSFHIKDNASIDLDNVVIYVNGNYYTKNGGPGVVTTNGTKITFANSLSFAAFLSGIPTDYAFVIDPQASFTEGEGVPVIIYAKDTSGNIMERVVYTNVVAGAGCASGSTYCGSNTSWDSGLLRCIGTGGGNTCPVVTGGSTLPFLSIDPQTANVAQIDSTSVLVTWHSSLAGTGRVIWDTEQPDNNFGSAPNYNYTYSTKENSDNSVYHAVIVSGLSPGHLYYFRPVTRSGTNEVRGPELLMVSKYETQIVEKTCPVVKPEVKPTYKPTYFDQTGTKTTTGSSQQSTTAAIPSGSGAIGGGKSLLRILNIIRITEPADNLGRTLRVTGEAGPLLKLKATIY